MTPRMQKLIDDAAQDPHGAEHKRQVMLLRKSLRRGRPSLMYGKDKKLRKTLLTLVKQRVDLCEKRR